MTCSWEECASKGKTHCSTRQSNMGQQCYSQNGRNGRRIYSVKSVGLQVHGLQSARGVHYDPLSQGEQES